VLNHIADAFPVRPFNEALIGPVARHTGFAWGHLGVLFAWGLGGVLIAIRRFRWDPRPEWCSRVMTYGIVAVSVKGIAVVSMRTPLRIRSAPGRAIGSQFVGRGQRRRTIEQTLDRAWPLIGRFPRQRLLCAAAEAGGARYHQPTCVWRAQ